MAAKRRQKTLQQKVADRFERKPTRKRRRVVSASRTRRRNRRHNPFKKRPEEQQQSRQKWLLIAAAALVVSTIGLLIYHPFFRIHTVQINGLERLAYGDVEESVNGIIDYRRFLVVPGSSYFAVNVTELRDILLERFPIDAIEVRKQFPNTIHITITEKLSTIIFDDGEYYQFVDLQGHAVERLRKVGEDEWDIEIEVTTTTLADGTIRTEEHELSRTHTPNTADIEASYGMYPIIYHTQGRANDSQLLPPHHIAHSINWYHLLNSSNDPFAYMIVGENAFHASIYTKSGVIYHINIQNEPQSQFEALQHVLEQEIKGNYFSYIDVRFPGRVYWK